MFRPMYTISNGEPAGYMLPMREVFALKVMEAMNGANQWDSPSAYAAYVYRVADALMAEAQKVPAKGTAG